jgi:hypothetical protein
MSLIGRDRKPGCLKRTRQQVTIVRDIVCTAGSLDVTIYSMMTVYRATAFAVLFASLAMNPASSIAAAKKDANGSWVKCSTLKVKRGKVRLKSDGKGGFLCWANSKKDTVS